jgi:hypothetical protein
VAKPKPQLIGINGLVEYYYAPVEEIKINGKPTGQWTYKIAWRVPEIREAVGVPSPEHRILDADYCLDPSTLVLGRDLKWGCAGDLKVDRLLVGFDENKEPGKGKRRRMHTTAVESVRELKQPCVRIITEGGEVICSELHRWLVRKYDRDGYRGTCGTVYWKEAGQIEVGNSICWFGEPWKEDRSYDAGWLSGILDGEGYIHDGAAFGQNAGPVFDKAIALLKARGFNPEFTPNNSGCLRGRLLGGTYSALRLLGELQPIRLVNDAEKIIEGHDVTGRFRPAQKVLAVEKVGVRDVVGIQTGTKTFIANGFLSHNSQIEIKLMAYLSKDPWLCKAVNSGKDLHCFFTTDIWGAKFSFDYETIFNADKDENHPRHDELHTLRGDTKSVVFMIPYGASAMGVSLRTGKTLDESQVLIDGFFSKATVLKVWLEEQARNAIYNGYSTSDYGRKRFYVLPKMDDPDADRKLGQIKRFSGNQPIQSSSADMIKKALALIYKRVRGGVLNGPKLYDTRVLLAVHDEIAMLTHQKDEEAVKKIMEDSMNEAYWSIIPRWDKEPDGIHMPYGLVNKIDVVAADYWKK